MIKNSQGFSEDNARVIYDKTLFKNIVKYLKPYLFYIIASFILLISNTGIELYLPYLTKTIIDDYVVSDKNIATFDNKADFSKFDKELKGIKVKKYSYQNKYYVIFSTKSANLIPKNILNDLKKSNVIKDSKVFLTDNNDEIRTVKNIRKYQLSKDLIAMSSEDFSKNKKDISASVLRIIRKSAIHGIKYYGIIYLLLVLLRFIITYIQIYVITYAAQHAMYALRKDVFAHLGKMPLSFFDKNPVGRLVTRVTNDIRTLDELLSSGLVQIVQDSIILVGIIVMMLIIDYKMALVSFIVVPFIVAAMVIFKRKTRKIYNLTRKKIAKINAVISEDISGMRIIQLFNRQTFKMEKFRKENDSYFNTVMNQVKLYAFFRPLVGVTRYFTIGIILWYAGGRSLHNTLSLGVFMAFMRYLERFFQPINSLSEKFNILQSAFSGAERVFGLLNLEPEDYRMENHKDIKLDGEIKFENVWMAYNAGDWILKDVSFTAKKGETIAIVGHTGAGKTSIVNLILNMYPFQKGRILLDGEDIHSYSLKDIRQNIGMVQQDVFIFSGNVKDNIVLDNKTLSLEEVDEISREVNLKKFIDVLPKKYDEEVMERGSNFSVGQRQLMAFARVLVYNPAIFILDEATSNIDTETEILIQEALEKVIKDRTSLIIAHRLSTIQNADRILVMHKGKIVEEGNHQELLTKGGLYYDLYKLQYEKRK